MSLKDDGVFAAALIGVVMCALSFALLDWRFCWSQERGLIRATRKRRR